MNEIPGINFQGSLKWRCWRISEVEAERKKEQKSNFLSKETSENMHNNNLGRIQHSRVCP